MRILGVDPGLAITGYGLVEIKEGQPLLLEAGVVKTRRGDAVETRLATLYEGLKEIMEEHRPDTVVIEEVYFEWGRPGAGIKIGHARGVLFLAAAKSGLPVISYAATRIKKALTGNGRASKEQVQRMTMARLRLENLPGPKDVSDALAAALCHCNASLVISHLSLANGKRRKTNDRRQTGKPS